MGTLSLPCRYAMEGTFSPPAWLTEPLAIEEVTRPLWLSSTACFLY